MGTFRSFQTSAVTTLKYEFYVTTRYTANLWVPNILKRSFTFQQISCHIELEIQIKCLDFTLRSSTRQQRFLKVPWDFKIFREVTKSERPYWNVRNSTHSRNISGYVNRNFPGKFLNLAVSLFWTRRIAQFSVLFWFIRFSVTRTISRQFSGQSGLFRNVLFTFESRQLILFWFSQLLNFQNCCCVVELENSRNTCRTGDKSQRCNSRSLSTRNLSSVIRLVTKTNRKITSAR